jgi:hypothetical protein
MYTYAILNDNNICHTVYLTDIERTDFDSNAIPIETYDLKYLQARWDDNLNEWDFPPDPEFIWSNGIWIDPKNPIFPEPQD